MRICIVTTNKAGYSETFIRNHITYLPFEKIALYNGDSAILYDMETDKPLTSPFVAKIKKAFFLGKASNYVDRYLSHFLKKEKVAVVLAEFGPVGENIANACREARIPLVVHFHGDDAHAERFFLQYDGYQRLVKYASAVIGVSKPMVERLILLGFSEEKIHLIPYGIDTSFFSCGKTESSSLNFVAVGRFVDKKAPHLTILAFHSILQRVPDATLTMIGTGSLLLSCKILAKALQINESVTFKGVCTSEEVRKCMQQSRAFLMHSVTPDTGEKEGTPLSILEASAMELPIVSTMHAGIPEAVVHGETGFLVEEGSIDAMAEYMLKLAESPLLARSMGEAGKKHIENHYCLDKQIDKLAKVIEDQKH